MMAEKHSRREFLKLASLATVSGLSTQIIQSRLSPTLNDRRPNIILLLFDTLSALHLKIHGYRRDTTPHLARFAERATVYHSHYSPGNFTTSGTASLVSGTYPWKHRGTHIRGTVQDTFSRRNIFRLFSDSQYTCFAFSHNMLVNILLNQFASSIHHLAMPTEVAIADRNITDYLLANDYRAAIQSEESFLKSPGGNSNSLFFSLITWLIRTITTKKINQSLADRFPRGVPQNHDIFYLLEDTFDWLLPQLQALQNPYLAYLHLMPPHAPYNTRVEFVDKFKDDWIPIEKPEHIFTRDEPFFYLNILRGMYDEYLSYVDAEFGRFYEMLSRSDLLENTWLIVTSDHGEMFERGISYHNTQTLYEPIIRIPLLISGPGQTERGDIYETTSAIDVLPTLLHIIGDQPPSWSDGRILPPFQDTQVRETFAVDAKSSPRVGPLTIATVAMIRGPYKLIKYWGYSGVEDFYELYDLEQDPEELVDLTEIDPSLTDDLIAILERKLQEMDETSP
jgi:arylsulfatase A-like enzyme